MSENKKRLVIVGASGMVGGHALHYALAHPDVAQVTSIGRRALDIQHPKLTQVQHGDFGDCAALADALSGQDAAVFCLGAYTGAVSDEELRKTSWDYPVEFARVLHAASPDAAFAFLSGLGADPTGRSRAAFARYKGGAEKALGEMGIKGLSIFRPAYIYPVEPRAEPNFSYRLLRGIYPVFRRVFPGSVIPSDDLGEAMVTTVLRSRGEASTQVLENRAIQAIARAS
ncbi:MAG: NAD(P)H-binding protein [Pseudomonadota bacterium]|nr:NAD(P)H-binding protein [Pseudomonadota bacterium]